MSGMDLCRLIGEIDESHVERAYCYNGVCGRRKGCRNKTLRMTGFCEIPAGKKAAVIQYAG